ncbi:MAG: hypothetical protein WC405_16385 [Syntrophales bacterium]
MRTYLKIAYITVSVALLIYIGNNLPSEGPTDDLFTRLMSIRLIGFVALMLVFYYIFFNFLGKRKGGE